MVWRTTRLTGCWLRRALLSVRCLRSMPITTITISSSISIQGQLHRGRSTSAVPVRRWWPGWTPQTTTIAGWRPTSSRPRSTLASVPPAPPSRSRRSRSARPWSAGSASRTTLVRRPTWPCSWSTTCRHAPPLTTGTCQLVATSTGRPRIRSPATSTEPSRYRLSSPNLSEVVEVVHRRM